ncbi:exocyst complex component Sec10 [Venturia nashicola]|nr:exocyst complex component Sec10 [Venturia nashicola]
MAYHRASEAPSVRSQETRRSTLTRGPTFHLDTFESKDFIVKDFVETLSENATSRRSAPASAQQAAFDPKPLIRTFEAALSRLGSLSEDLTEQETELSTAVRRAESQHNQTVSSLSRKLEEATDQFNRLENTLNGGIGDSSSTDAGGAVALQIGEKLEELERQRQRAVDTKDLIEYWIEVSEQGSLSRLEDKRRLGGSSKVQCAAIARQLLKISHRLDPEHSSQMNGKHANGTNGTRRKDMLSSNDDETTNRTRVVIEKFLESLEKDLLDQFDDHYRRQNLNGMRDCAIAVRDFNDGSSVIGMFVNQHQFFIDKSQLVTEAVGGDTETWERIADADAEPPGVEPGLQALIDEIRLVVQEECFTIKRAFPFYEEVLTRFLQRVFQQSIQQRLELVLEKAESISTLAFLRTVQTSRSYISSMVEDLKSHGLTEHPEPATPQIVSFLDQQMEELFTPYLTGVAYIEREKKSLEYLYRALLFKFTMYHERRKKMTTTSMLDRMAQRSRQFVESTREAYFEKLDSADIPASQKAMLIRLAGIKSADSNGDKKIEIEVTEEDGQLDILKAKKMLRWLAEGVGRGLELNGGGTETPKDIQALHQLLITHMGDIYIDSSLDWAVDMATSQESVTKVEPDLSFLPSLRSSIQILHLLQTSVNTMLLPLALSNVTIRRDVEKTTTATISRLESKVSLILHKTLDVSLAWTARLLANQKKTDFKPKEEDVDSAIGALQTPTCLWIYNFVTKVANLANTTLDGSNLSSFLSELALGLRALLLEHLKKFPVSLLGGIILSKDVAKYEELVQGWKCDGTVWERQEGMKVVKDVANLFIISPEALRERLRGSGKGSDEVAELRKYVERREDVGSVGVQAVLSGL